MKFQIVGFTLGLLVTILGFAEMFPAMIDMARGHPNGEVFFFNGIVCLFFGGAMVIANRDFKTEMTVREAFLLTSLSWITMAGFAALPLYMADLQIDYADAYFETMSGFTTTGSTVLSGLDGMSHGILVWRSMIQWIGGMGIVGFAIILLPFLKVGGMQLFQTESSDKSDKIMPRSGEVVASLFYVYALITVVCILTYYVLGMSWFDAINHALTTICTGGYSTHDASFGHFKSAPLEYAASFFMLLGGLPFVLFIKAVMQRQFLFWADEQFRALIQILFVLTLVMTVWAFVNTDLGVEASFRYSLFSIISVITTTGFAATDYTAWGNFAIIFFFFITYMGASAGSTAGGIKTMRIIIAAKVASRQIKALLYPRGVFAMTYQGKELDDGLVLTVLGFLSLYVMSNVFVTIALSLVGLDFYTAVSGAATAIANVGPGIGEIIGPSGNFSSLPDSAKWILSFAMLLGRLEILTVVVLFSSDYWRK